MNNPQQSGLSPKKPNTALVVLCCIFLPFVALILTWTLWKNAWDSKKKAIMTAILSAYTVIFLAAAFGGSGSQENTDDPITSSISEVTSENSEESSQTEDPEPTATPVPTEEPTPEPESEPEESEPEETDTTTMGERNALKAAQSYLDYSAFSYEGLIDQLEFEGYSNDEATYAADNCEADWNEQALKSAKSYLEYSAFSYTGLIDQLEFEGFTADQATYGADNCDADWNEQAAKSAESYLEYSAFSRDGLIEQLEFEGFTHEQAVYGAEANG